MSALLETSVGIVGELVGLVVSWRPEDTGLDLWSGPHKIYVQLLWLTKPFTPFIITRFSWIL